MSVSYHHRVGFISCLVLALTACGSSKVTAPPPPPVTTGSISFTIQNCPPFATAEYVVDSVTLGTEQLVVGGLSKSYTVPSGKRSAKAVLRNPGQLGTWTFNDIVTVPENGSVIAHPHC